MATETRMGHFGGKGTSTAGLDVIGAHDTGWSDYTIQECAFVPYADCTITVNGVDVIEVLASTPLNFSEADGITSIAITEADIVYQVFCRVLGTYTA